MAGFRWFLKMGELSDISMKGLISSGFELVDCKYGFYQGVDEYGKAETNVHLEGIDVVYDGLPSMEVINWAMNPRLYYNGALVLYNEEGLPQEKLFFEDGACTDMHISYVSDGESYATTKLTIYPRAVKIGDNTFLQPWTYNHVSQQVAPSCKSILDKIFQPIGKTNARLKVGIGIYELESFDITFSQGVDWKGQPQEETRGGIMQCTISGQPMDDVKKWALVSNALKSGTVDFYQELTSSPLSIQFAEAFCIGMTPFRHGSGEMRTQIVISANEIILNGKSLFKDWKL